MKFTFKSIFKFLLSFNITRILNSRSYIVGVIILYLKTKILPIFLLNNVPLLNIDYDENERDIVEYRTSQGIYNNKSKCPVGAVKQLFQRNINYTEYESYKLPLNDPPVDNVADKLMKITSPTLAPHLNIFVCAWIQLMTHDWFSHKTTNEK